MKVKSIPTPSITPNDLLICGNDFSINNDNDCSIDNVSDADSIDNVSDSDSITKLMPQKKYLFTFKYV